MSLLFREGDYATTCRQKCVREKRNMTHLAKRAKHKVKGPKVKAASLQIVRRRKTNLKVTCILVFFV